MTFTELSLPGVFVVDADVFSDDRGDFVRGWIREEFASRGLDTSLAQAALARTITRGSIRGMHYQAPPHAEAKLVRTIRGGIFDVAVDLRPDSPTFMRWEGLDLTAENRRAVYLPKGVAHGYQTLTADVEVLYFVSTPYAPDAQRGVRWNDPAFAIEWPLGPPPVIHDRDASYPDFVPSHVSHR